MTLRRPMVLARAGMLALALALAALAPPVLATDAPLDQVRPKPAPNRPPLDAMPDGTAPATAPEVGETGIATEPVRKSVTNLPLPRYVSLKGSEGNARRGPGRTHRIDWVFVRPGMPLRVTAEYENWRLVEDAEGAGGWVHYTLISGIRTVLVQQDMTPFYNLPDTRSAVVFKAERGVIARILQCEADWCRLLADGQRGWAEKSALWGVDPGEIID